MNYTNSSNRLHVPVRAGLAQKPAIFLSLERSARGLHLRVRTAVTLAPAAVALCVAPLTQEALVFIL